MEKIARPSPRQLARIAGGLYLMVIVGGLFAIGCVPAAIIVPGDPAATAHNLQAHELRLLVVGVNAQRWREQASAVERSRAEAAGHSWA